MNGSTYHVHEEPATCGSSILLWQVYVQVKSMQSLYVDSGFVR